MPDIKQLWEKYYIAKSIINTKVVNSYKTKTIPFICTQETEKLMSQWNAISNGNRWNWNIVVPIGITDNLHYINSSWLKNLRDTYNTALYTYALNKYLWHTYLFYLAFKSLDIIVDRYNSCSQEFESVLYSCTLPSPVLWSLANLGSLHLLL